MKIKYTRKNIIITVIIITVIIVASILLFKNGNKDQEIVKVERKDLIEEVKIIGNVEADLSADLGLSVSGRVNNVSAVENRYVSKGDILMRLDLGTLPSQLSSAEADLFIKQAESSNASVTLNGVISKQDALVQSAYATLLSEGLSVTPTRESFTQTPPTISGRYVGPEGIYKIRVNRGQQSGDFVIDVYNLEPIQNIEINETSPTPLGTNGLFIDFSDDLNDYVDTTWNIVIPNTKSSYYVSNYNSYQEALSERDRAIEEAKNNIRDVESQSSIASFEIQIAAAEVSKIRTEIGERILTAPFDGFVVSVNADPGEAISANTVLVTLISDDLGVRVNLPETDRVKVSEGDLAIVSIETLNNKQFSGSLVSVNRAETQVDGVSVYEARLEFDELADELASGMTAEVTIVTDKRAQVLALPLRAVQFRKDGISFVEVLEKGKIREIEVSTGLKSTDGFVEITSGLEEGQEIVISL